MKVGFIGLGVMGAAMTERLVDAGHEVTVFTRTKSKAEKLLRKGASWCANPAEVSRFADTICTLLGYPQDVEEVYLGEQGPLEHAGQGTLLIDFTTSSPALARRLAAEGLAKRVGVLDAPVSGGDTGAKGGRLSIMVGGRESDVVRARPLFDLLGKTIVHQGDAGSGQLTKLCNQIAIASNMLGVCEALVFAKRNGLDPERVLSSIEHGAAGSWSLTNLAPRMLTGDLDPGFYVHHFIKDMSLALEVAMDEGLALPGLELALNRYRELAKQGGELLGTQGLIRVYEG
jgi:3-hydroxyisobutyrate dehydrogenase-like beta-hydroxyacid dehydrogenase